MNKIIVGKNAVSELLKKAPLPKQGETAMQFIKNQAEELARTKLVEMFGKSEAFLVERDGNNLYILDNIYDVWPEEENRGKPAKMIAEIVQHKIREYSRVNDEFEYKKAEYKFAGAGVMRVLFYFEKQINY